MILQVLQFSVISKILDSVFCIMVFWDIEIYTISLPSLIKHNNMAKHRWDSELPSIFAQCGRIQAWVSALYLLFHVHGQLNLGTGLRFAAAMLECILESAACSRWKKMVYWAEYTKLVGRMQLMKDLWNELFFQSECEWHCHDKNSTLNVEG